MCSFSDSDKNLTLGVTGLKVFFALFLLQLIEFQYQLDQMAFARDQVTVLNESWNFSCIFYRYDMK